MRPFIVDRSAIETKSPRVLMKLPTGIRLMSDPQDNGATL